MGPREGSRRVLDRDCSENEGYKVQTFSSKVMALVFWDNEGMLL